MTWIRQNPPRALLIVGALIAAQSVLWEWVRMRPDYRFLIEPWSLRGYRLTQGRVVLVLAIGILILGMVSWSKWTESNGARAGYIVGVGVIVGAGLIAAIAVSESRDIKLNDIGGIGVSLTAALVVTVPFRDFAAKRFGNRTRYAAPAVLLVSFLVVFLAVVRPLLVGERITTQLWLIVAVALLLVFIPMVTSPPAQLGVARILIIAVAISWLVAAVSAGAARSTLIRLQLEATGGAAQDREAQITSGMMLAFVGFALAFLGAVALWAGRRDQIAAQQRASQQRAAAEDSLSQLASE